MRSVSALISGADHLDVLLEDVNTPACGFLSSSQSVFEKVASKERLDILDVEELQAMPSSSEHHDQYKQATMCISIMSSAV